MYKTLAVFLALISLPLTPCSYGADAKAELQALVDKIIGRLRAGNTSEADFTDELKSFDALLAEHQGEKTDDVANILYMKVSLYERFQNEAKITEGVQKLKADFPDTAPARQADTLLARVVRKHAANEAKQRLVVGAPFPDFHEADLNGTPFSVANYQGKLVLQSLRGGTAQRAQGVLSIYEKETR